MRLVRSGAGPSGEERLALGERGVRAGWSLGGSLRAGRSFQFARRTPHPRAGSRPPEAPPNFKQGASPGSHTLSQLLKGHLSSWLPGLFFPTSVPPAPPVECGTLGRPGLGEGGGDRLQKGRGSNRCEGDLGAGRARQAFPPSAHPLAVQVNRSGEWRWRWAQECAQVCALHVLVSSLEGRSAPTPRWASHVLRPRGGSAAAGPVSSEVQASGCSARGRAAGLV